MYQLWKVIILSLLSCALLVACDSDNNNDNNGKQLAYVLPGDIAAPDQENVDYYSWQTFLALNAPGVGERVSVKGDNPTQYSEWSSSFELIRCNLDDTDCVCPDGDCSQSGTRYYPPTCQEVENYTDYRVIDNADKADDSFLEAETGGLSNQPVITSQGSFVRYEILVNPAFYRHVVENQYYDWHVLKDLPNDVTNLCGEESYTGGDPADPRSGTYEVKLAWMEDGLADASYHREDLLVYTPAYRSSTGTAACEVKSMAMVGMHIAHKTLKQPNYTWSTFEHKDNSPECSGLPPSGSGGNCASVNTNCPAADTLTQNYHFPSPACADGSCADCNIPPNTNDPLSMCVTDPLSDQAGWCLDQPPASVAGKSQLCRQVPIEANYPSAYAWNNTYAELLGEKSVWSNYQLVSTQWYEYPDAPTSCANVASGFNSSSSRDQQRPQIDVEFPRGETRPMLANNSMESYERSNCNACHSKSYINQEGGVKRYTDFVYWIPLESCAVWCDLNSVEPCTCFDSISK